MLEYELSYTLILRLVGTRIQGFNNSRGSDLEREQSSNR
jgi:hypothetical protein